MPIPLLAAPIGGVLTAVLRYVFMAHLAGFVIRAFSVLGLTLVTNEMIVDPLMDLIQGRANGMPAEMVEWFGFLGLDTVLSILISAHSIAAVKRVFLGKSA